MVDPFDGQLEPLAVKATQVDDKMKITDACHISAAISLKRIADALVGGDGHEPIRDMIWRIAENGRPQ